MNARGMPGLGWYKKPICQDLINSYTASLLNEKAISK